MEAAEELFPEANWQRCTVHCYCDVFSHVPSGKVAEVARMLKAIHAQEDGQAAADKVKEVIAKLRAMKLPKAAELLETSAHETLTYYRFPSNHWRQLRTNNPMERIIRESRRRAAGSCKQFIGAPPNRCFAALQRDQGTAPPIRRPGDLESDPVRSVTLSMCSTIPPRVARRPGADAISWGRWLDLILSIEAFVRVAEGESFANAARQMGVAKSVATTRVKQLEEHLGVSLFHRSTRAIKLSEAGHSYYQNCRDLLTRVEELSKRSQEEVSALKGTLRIHVLPGFALGHFSKALVDFREAHPKIEFDVHVNDRVVDPVQEGLDVAIQIYPAASNSLVERKLFPVRGLFCASPKYLAEEPALETPLDLLHHDFARYSYYPWGDDWPLIKGTERFTISLRPVLKTNSVHLLLEFARAGAGVAYLPTMVAAPDLLEGRLQRVLPEYAAPPLWLSAVYPSSHRGTAKVKLFIDFLLTRFPSEPQWDRALDLPPVDIAPFDD